MNNYGLYNDIKPSIVFGKELNSFYKNGFVVLPNILSAPECDRYINKLKDIYLKQEREFTTSKLEQIGETNTVRALLTYDLSFLNLVYHPIINQLGNYILGEYYILHLQNGIILNPNQKHHQQAWHRDLPYQNFTTSDPIAFSTYFLPI